jgi:CO/xanthine dehydrogenase FAD-binding subunit
VAISVPAYLRPATLEEALDALAGGGEPRLVVSGGTDVYASHADRPIERQVLDVSRIDGLRGIARDGDDGGWRIGATTTWTDVAEASFLPPAFDGLRAAARQVGGRQIQNAGTVAGNIVTASPAADGTPNLLALDAVAEVASAGTGRRRVPLREFVTGYRTTALAPDELVTAVLVPDPGAGARSAFRKLGSRAYLVISIVSVAVVVRAEHGIVRDARVAVGACSPVPVRLADLEAALHGRPADASLAAVARPDHLAPLSPIDDVRGPAAYRLDAALTLIRRALAEVVA